MTIHGDLAPTARLRFVERPCGSALDDNATMHVLQQWFAEDVPAYMRASAKGEWRDVEVGIEAP
jgi:hypothetical protein